MVLIEHQSTINPNMAVRLLMYIGRVYEKTINSRKVYSGARFPIPRPEFFVLYNGPDPYPDEKILRLSDSFEGLSSLGLAEKEKVALELEVRVLNINEGRNADIVQRCRKLAEYSALVASVREFEKKMGNSETAIKSAIRHCQSHNILRVFLEEHASEVLSMLMTKWNLGDAIAVAREEGRAEEREQFVRNLLAMGMPIEEIARATELPVEQVRAIAEKQGI